MEQMISWFLSHEYTVSLLFFIVPCAVLIPILLTRKALSTIVTQALVVNLLIMAGIGFVLDLLFAHCFFTFPDPNMVLGITIRGIPIEEFLFYLFGFWFIILFYVFNDEIFLKRYNVDDRLYARFARRLKKPVYFHYTVESLMVLIILVAVDILIKYLTSAPGSFTMPGYILFLTIAAYIPFLFFWSITRYFVNTRALVFTIVVTTLISIIWEVTLALPRGYWNYNHTYMVGIFISFWSDLPIEAITVWLFSSLIILSYEYTKVILHRDAAKKEFIQNLKSGKGSDPSTSSGLRL